MPHFSLSRLVAIIGSLSLAATPGSASPVAYEGYGYAVQSASATSSLPVYGYQPPVYGQPAATSTSVSTADLTADPTADTFVYSIWSPSPISTSTTSCSTDASATASDPLPDPTTTTYTSSTQAYLPQPTLDQPCDDYGCVDATVTVTITIPVSPSALPTDIASYPTPSDSWVPSEWPEETLSPYAAPTESAAPTQSSTLAGYQAPSNTWAPSGYPSQAPYPYEQPPYPSLSVSANASTTTCQGNTQTVYQTYTQTATVSAESETSTSCTSSATATVEPEISTSCTTSVTATVEPEISTSCTSSVTSVSGSAYVSAPTYPSAYPSPNPMVLTYTGGAVRMAGVEKAIGAAILVAGWWLVL